MEEASNNIGRRLISASPQGRTRIAAEDADSDKWATGSNPDGVGQTLLCTCMCSEAYMGRIGELKEVKERRIRTNIRSDNPKILRPS